MEPKARKKVAVFFTHGVSLELWEIRGIFSREVRFYQELADHVGEIWFFTYGQHDARFNTRLGSRIRIFPKRLPIPNLLYSLLLPFLHWRELSNIQIIRIHQVAGAIPALITHWLLHKPVIVRAGFQWYTFARQQHTSRLKLWLISFVEWFTYRSARAIIHTTQQDAHFVARRYRINTQRLHVIPNWVDTEVFKPSPVPKEPRSICFVGRLEPQKNLQNLVEALQGVDAHLNLYGDGSLKKDLEQRALTLGVTIHFHGRIANDKVPAALNACELFILPSWYEGHPKSLLEAMACGLPVIGTNVDGIESLIQDGRTGLLCEPTSHSIRQAIVRLLGDDDLRARLGSAAREWIIASESLPQAVRRELTLYEL